MTVRTRLAWFVPIFLVSVLLDQVTKAWARGALVEGISQPVLGSFWSWRLSFNTGVAFSMPSDLGAAGRVILPIIAIAVIATVVWMAARSPDAGRGQVTALALIASGALGNVIDRLAFGKVTDFVLWRAFGFSWPVFNIADVSLVAGVIVMLLWGRPRAATQPAH